MGAERRPDYNNFFSLRSSLQPEHSFGVCLSGRLVFLTGILGCVIRLLNCSVDKGLAHGGKKIRLQGAGQYACTEGKFQLSFFCLSLLSCLFSTS